jgi:peroxiredoxin
MPALLLACLSAGMATGQQPGSGTAMQAGQPAPDVELPGIGWEKVLGKKATAARLKDFAGKKNVVLFFYPKAMTFG